MLDLTDVTSLNFAASYANKAYSTPRAPWAAASSGDLIDAMDGDFAGPIIENYARAEIAMLREFAANAVEAISMIQTFDNAVSTMLEKLERMQELADERSGSSFTYSESEKADLQQEFEDLVDEVNDLVNGTESGDNKLLSSQGQSVSVSVGSSSTILISPMNLGIDVERVDLSIAAGGQGALVVGSALEEVTSYKDYLADKAEELAEVSTALELDMSEAAGDTSSIEKVLSLQTAAETLSQIIDQASLLIEAQASLRPGVALKLLSA